MAPLTPPSSAYAGKELWVAYGCLCLFCTVFGRRENAGNKIKITLFTQLALIQYLNQSE